MINSDMLNMHMSPIIVKLSERPMQSTVAPVPPELSNRVVVLLSDEMLKALDEWRWGNRVSSRGEAIRMMVADKLERESGPPKRGKDKPSK
jgi:Ribbon-helix-helix protein, copG family